MSLATIFDRTVSIVPRIEAPDPDAHGNAYIVDGPAIEGIRARRRLTSATEDVDGADDQRRTYTYALAPYRMVEGERVVVDVTGYDLLVDGLETFTIVGEPRFVLARRGVLHHVSLEVERHGPRPEGVTP